MKLIPYKNSSEINENHQNNVITVAMGIADIISIYYYCDLIIFILKRIHISYLGFVLNVLHMKKKLKR
jgi:hypothetical protein